MGVCPPISAANAVTILAKNSSFSSFSKPHPNGGIQKADENIPSRGSDGFAFPNRFERFEPSRAFFFSFLPLAHAGAIMPTQ
jgi:hypothetical protein